MTAVQSAPANLPVARRSPRAWRLLLVVAVVLAGVGLLAASGLKGSLVYYKTPTELMKDRALQGQRVRLGGLVVTGSVARGAQGVQFTLTDGVTDVRVINSGQPRGVFQEGQGALVEGVLGADRVFRSDVLLVKHSNSYEPPKKGVGRPAKDSG